MEATFQRLLGAQAGGFQASVSSQSQLTGPSQLKFLSRFLSPDLARLLWALHGTICSLHTNNPPEPADKSASTNASTSMSEGWGFVVGTHRRLFFDALYAAATVPISTAATTGRESPQGPAVPFNGDACCFGFACVCLLVPELAPTPSSAIALYHLIFAPAAVVKGGKRGKGDKGCGMDAEVEAEREASRKAAWARFDSLVEELGREQGRSREAVDSFGTAAVAPLLALDEEPIVTTGFVRNYTRALQPLGAGGPGPLLLTTHAVYYKQPKLKQLFHKSTVPFRYALTAAALAQARHRTLTDRSVWLCPRGVWVGTRAKKKQQEVGGALLCFAELAAPHKHSKRDRFLRAFRELIAARAFAAALAEKGRKAEEAGGEGEGRGGGRSVEAKCVATAKRSVMLYRAALRALLTRRGPGRGEADEATISRLCPFANELLSEIEVEGAAEEEGGEEGGHAEARRGGWAVRQGLEELADQTCKWIRAQGGGGRLGGGGGGGGPEESERPWLPSKEACRSMELCLSLRQKEELHLQNERTVAATDFADLPRAALLMQELLAPVLGLVSRPWLDALLRWRRPGLTAVVLCGLWCVVIMDLLPALPPLLLLMLAAQVWVGGRQKGKRAGHNQPKMTAPKKPKKANPLKRLQGMRAKSKLVKAKLHVINNTLLKLHGVFLWTSPYHSRLICQVLVLVSALLCLAPKMVFCAMITHVMTSRVDWRQASMAKTRAKMKTFWDGIPMLVVEPNKED